jgi:5-methylcytosine-specific restriction endonuclease McrA
VRLPAPLAARNCALPDCSATFTPKEAKQRCCCERHGKTLYNRESRADGRQANQAWSDRRRDNYHRRKALKKGSSSGDRVDLGKIAARDHWVCQLCKRKVDRMLFWPHPKSPSIDHVIPLTKGGMHEPANVQLAHLVCNTAKGNRGGGEQLALIG